MSISKSIRIAIIGGGPAGLTCARVLQNYDYSPVVYENDAALYARDGGGTLDLHADSGQIALEEAGLVEAFHAVARLEGQAKKRMSHKGEVVNSFVPDAADAAAPEIDRRDLRAMLAENLKPDTIRWDHKLVSVTQLPNGSNRLEFQHGQIEEADFVIGADGVWSKVRPLLSDAKPEYTGVSFIEVDFADVATRHPALSELVGPGHVFATDKAGHGIVVQKNSNGHIRGYIMMLTPADWYEQEGISLTDEEAIRQYLLNEFKDWGPALIPFLTETDTRYVNRSINVLPAPLTWTSNKSVTLIGDAAHCMAPFGGFGVNLAMLDAAEIARAVAEHETIAEAIAAYESIMIPRAGELAVGSNIALNRFLSVDAGEGPDHAEEHRQYQEAAKAYRERQASSSGLMEHWIVSYKVPSGEKNVDFSFSKEEEELKGLFDGQPIIGGRLSENGTRIIFTVKLTSPFSMKVKFTMTILGDKMEGTAKAPMMKIPVKAVRGQQG